MCDSTQSAQDLGRRRRYDSCDGVVELLKNKRFSVFHFELKSCTDTENIPPPNSCGIIQECLNYKIIESNSRVVF
jgi:hypothetical protein